MAKRDIKIADILEPQKLRAAGPSLAGGGRGADNVQLRGKGLPDAPGFKGYEAPDNRREVQALSEATHAVMESLNEDAFKQGQADLASDMLKMGNTVDSAAELIKRSSWLTRDSYTQGVRYQQYSEGQLGAQQEIADIASKSAEAGEPIEVFSQKIKPVLAKLNKQVTELGLKGPAKDAAHDQLLAYVVSSQKTYQKQLEFVTERNYNTTLNQTASAGLSLITQTTGPIESAQAFRITANNVYSVANGYDPLKGGDESGKTLRSVLKTVLDNANGMSPEDNERIAGYTAYLRSDESSFIPQEHRAAMLTDIAQTQKRFQENNSYTVNNTLREFETMFASTGSIDHSVLQQAAIGIQQQMRLGQLKISDGDQAMDRLNRLGLKADEEMGLKARTVGATLDERRAFGISDKKQTTELHKVATKQAYAEGNPERAGFYMAKEAVRLSNYHALTEAHKQLAGNYVSALTLGEGGKASPIAERTFLLDKQLYGDNVLHNDVVSSSYQLKAWQSTLGQDGAAAMDILMRDPSVNSVQDAMSRFPQVLERVQDNRMSGNMGNVRIQPDTLKSGMFGQLFGVLGTKGAAYGKEADPDILAAQTARIQQVYLKNKSYLIGKYNIQTDDGGESALKAMYAEGLLTRTDYGTVIMNTATKRVYGGGNEVSPDAIIRIDNAIRDTVITEMGPGANAAKENMQIEYTPGGATVTVYTDNVWFSDTVQGVYHYTADQIKNMEQATFDEQRGVKVPINTVPAYLQNGSAGNSSVFKDQGEFGSNTYKAEALSLIAAEEGYFQAPTTPKGRDFQLVGHSVRLDMYEKMFGEAKAKAFAAAAKDPSSKEYGELYDDFIREHFKGFPEVLKASGLTPDGTFGVSTPAKVLASTYYHGPSSAMVMAKAMGSLVEGGDFKSAVAAVKQTPAYQQAGPSRKKTMLSALEALR